MKFTEKELRTIEAVFDSLSKLEYAKLNKFLGSMTIVEMMTLANKMRYAEYCERHGIAYEDMTEEDFVDAALENVRR